MQEVDLLFTFNFLINFKTTVYGIMNFLIGASILFTHLTGALQVK